MGRYDDGYRPPVYLPWPMVMDIADACEANGYTQLARDARKAVWLEAERLAALSGRTGDTDAR